MTGTLNNKTSDANPTQLIAALYGSTRVTLAGFGAEPMPNSWVRPGIRFVSVDSSPASVAKSAHARQKILMGIRGVIVALLIISSISAGMWFATSSSPINTSATSQMAWSVISVSNDGITISSNNSPFQVKLGSKLPNGETLMSTAPQRRAYVTDKSTSMINIEIPASNGAAK